jgi:hypothetical protein
MKKIVALLLSVLMLCSSVATYEGAQEAASGFFMDGEEKPDKDIKEDKKESKEFVSQAARKLHLSIHSAPLRGSVESGSLPSPIIDKQTPPPDTAC